jgi:N-acetyl-D-muramate 6-phosphate phosphatase
MIAAVLFDLDGTLADTAPDLSYALNRLLERHGRSPLPLEIIRPRASHGARGLLEIGFGLRPSEARYEELRDEFLELYSANIHRNTVLFPGVPEMLAELERRKIPWGVATNKIQRLTLPLLQGLALSTRAACIVCGDSYARAKPFPDPLLGAASLLGLPPAHIAYVGDDERDMQAGIAAGMHVIVAKYGYLGAGTTPETWQAHSMIEHPLELLIYLDSAASLKTANDLL